MKKMNIKIKKKNNCYVKLWLRHIKIKSKIIKTRKIITKKLQTKIKIATSFLFYGEVFAFQLRKESNVSNWSTGGATVDCGLGLSDW